MVLTAWDLQHVLMPCPRGICDWMKGACNMVWWVWCGVQSKVQGE